MDWVYAFYGFAAVHYLMLSLIIAFLLGALALASTWLAVGPWYGRRLPVAPHRALSVPRNIVNAMPSYRLVIGDNVPYAIPLGTAKGTKIPNGAYLGPLADSDKRQFVYLEKKYGATCKMRTPASPRYNCHGLTFAARRTGIFDEDSAENLLTIILSEDEYAVVEPDAALPGDLIVYFSDGGNIQHTGLILTSPKDEVSSFPLVCSKWGRYHELLHGANNCPYNWRNLKYYRIKIC